jgi:hypothetical protein
MDRHRAPGPLAAITALAVCVLALCIAVTPALAAKPLSAKQIANKVLRLDPRKPADIDLFTSTYEGGGPGLYPSGSTMQPASGPILTEAQARAKLKGYLRDQFPSDSSKVNAGLALFDGQKAKNMVPDPQLRAAFVGMKGTLLEPTINHLLNGGRFTSPVRYGGLPIGAVAASSGDSIVVARRYQSEDCRYLIGVMGHEILHDDFFLSTAEEAINTPLTAMTYLQVLSKHPELAYKGTELTRTLNSSSMIFLNSRENDSPNSEIFAPTGRAIAPGSPRNEPDFWSFMGDNGTTSPAPPPLGQITRNLGLPAATNFSLATAKTFAHLNDKWLSDVGRVQIEVLLQMVSVKTIAAKAKLSRAKVIRKLHLRPYLDAIK